LIAPSISFSIRNRIELFEAATRESTNADATCFSIRNRIELFEASDHASRLSTTHYVSVSATGSNCLKLL